jgi:hypothetical protein
MNACISFILVGVRMNGSSLHFFHRVSNAYGCGHRKRRKISDGNHVFDEHIRWHKTGRNKVICDENGVEKGWMEILVLHSLPIAVKEIWQV